MAAENAGSREIAVATAESAGSHVTGGVAAGVTAERANMAAAPCLALIPGRSSYSCPPACWQGGPTPHKTMIGALKTAAGNL